MALWRRWVRWNGYPVAPGCYTAFMAAILLACVALICWLTWRVTHGL